MLFFWHTVVLNWFCLLYTLSRPQSFELKFPMPIICLHLVYVHYFQLQWQMAPLSWGLRLNKTTFYPHQNLLQLLKLKIKHMVTAVAHAMFSSPLSFACRCATKKYCGLRNEMQPVRHGMALWVLLRCAQLLLNSICHAVKSYFTVLFLNLLRQTVLSICLWASCTWLGPQAAVLTWIIAIFVRVFSLSFSLGKPDKAGTSCHCSPRIPVTFTTWLRCHG